MYVWLFVVVGLIWLWLSAGSVLAWRSQGLAGFLASLSVLAWTGIAGLAILFLAPYWEVVYAVFGQPG